MGRWDRQADGGLDVLINEKPSLSMSASKQMGTPACTQTR